MLLCSTNFLLWKARQKLNREYERGIQAYFQILNFRRTISTYFQEVLFYSNYFCLVTALLLDNLDIE